MKRTTKILIGVGVLGGLVGANMWLRKSKATKAAEATPDATETTDASTTKSTNDLNDALKKLMGGTPIAPTTLSGYSATFKNRVYTKVLDFYGVKVSGWQTSKTLALYERIFDKLVAKNINPRTATLGQIGPVIKEIAKEGFPFGGTYVPAPSTSSSNSAPNPSTMGGYGRPQGRDDRESWA